MKLKYIIGLATGLFVNTVNGQITNLYNTTNYVYPIQLTVKSCNKGDTVKLYTSWDGSNWIHGATWPIGNEIDRNMWWQMRWNGIDDTLWVGWPEKPDMVETTYGHIHGPEKIPQYKIIVSKDSKLEKLSVNSKIISVKK